jgi:hypothetical protein
MEIRGSSFTAFIDVLTNNTYAMIVMSDPNIRKYMFHSPLISADVSYDFRISRNSVEYLGCQETL